jgi:hypothetical protein
MMNGKGLEENCHGLTEVLYWNFLGGTEEYHKKPQSR